MAYTVYLFSFTKKENSTARPLLTSGVQLDCNIKTESGVLNPVLQISLTYNTNPSGYNYAYISDFGRYYWIEESVFQRGLWELHLRVDVLATYKTNIGAASLYVLRASANSDGTIIDNLYPMKTGCSYDNTALTRPWIIAGTGCFVLGIVSKSPEFGSINYYAFDAAGLSALVTALLADSTLTAANLNLADASLELQKCLIDPLQYIKSAYYMPVKYADIPGTALGSIEVFDWTISAYCKQIPAASPYITGNETVTLKDHPDKTARGAYVNSAPFTKMQAVFPPFGVIDIDTTITCNAANITFEWALDLPSGRGILDIICNANTINRVEAQIGVPIQISQVTRDYLGGITSLVGGIAGAVGAGMAGNVAGAIGSGVGAIGNAINALVPRSQTIGSGGAYAQLFRNCRLEYQFFRPVDDDNTHHGRPYCVMSTPSSLTGYMLIQDGDVAIPGTLAEAKEIKQYLESGFYYE